nr:prepilin-type N-terminal cleavage/methylation domain-containing protein [Desulfobacula sp.]
MDKKGFTLMEVMVTIVVFSIVMLTLFSSFQAFVSSGDAITRGIHEAERARTALERMSEDLEQVHVIQPPRYAVPAFDAPPDPFRMAGSRTRVGGSVFSRLEFTTFSRVIAGPEEARGISKITYYVRQNPDKGFDLCRSDREPGRPERRTPAVIPSSWKRFSPSTLNLRTAGKKPKQTGIRILPKPGMPCRSASV